ncbi:DUF2782 domain-containing protein [Lysobacter humi (ex Lee et al. 2017)]
MRRAAVLPVVLVLAACASLPADPTAGLDAAEIRTRTEANGDMVSEYRVAGQLRVIKVVPRTGVTYYLTDDDNDGRFDRMRQDQPVRPVQYKVFGW